MIGQGAGKDSRSDGINSCCFRPALLDERREMVRFSFMTAFLTRWKPQVQILHAPQLVTRFSKRLRQGPRQDFRCRQW